MIVRNILKSHENLEIPALNINEIIHLKGFIQFQETTFFGTVISKINIDANLFLGGFD